MTFYFYDINRRKTDNPERVAYIAVPCKCQRGYLLTLIGIAKNPETRVRSWNKDMDAPTIDGSFDPQDCSCHFSIEDGRYKE